MVLLIVKHRGERSRCEQEEQEDKELEDCEQNNRKDTMATRSSHGQHGDGTQLGVVATTSVDTPVSAVAGRQSAYAKDAAQ